MASFDFNVLLTNNIEKVFSAKKLLILKHLCNGSSNKVIAQEINVSVKAVEKSLTDLNKKLGINNHLYSSRLRIIAHLISEGFCEYSCNTRLDSVKGLNANLRTTLILTSAGLSNKSLASLLNISTKAIEQRLSQLFDYFGIETKNQDAENPRVLLMISAYLRANLEYEQLSRVFKKTEAEKLKNIFEEPDLFVSNLINGYSLIG